jgi:hypothetical protein
MINEHLTVVLAERVKDRAFGCEHFLRGTREWTPPWRFQPASRLEDAAHVLAKLIPEKYVMGTADQRRLRTTIRIEVTTGEAHEYCQAAAITVAVARALGINTPSSTESSSNCLRLRHKQISRSSSDA